MPTSIDCLHSAWWVIYYTLMLNYRKKIDFVNALAEQTVSIQSLNLIWSLLPGSALAAAAPSVPVVGAPPGGVGGAGGGAGGGGPHVQLSFHPHKCLFVPEDENSLLHCLLLAYLLPPLAISN